MSDRHSCEDVHQADRYVSQKFWEDESSGLGHVNIRVVLNLRTLNCGDKMEPLDSTIFRVGK